MVGGDIARDGGDPGAEARRVAQVAQARKRAEEDILHEVFYFWWADAAEENAVHHADVTPVEVAEGFGVALLRCLDQSGVGVLRNWRRFGHPGILQDSQGGFECTVHRRIPWGRDSR